MMIFDPSCVLVCGKCENACYNTCLTCTKCGLTFELEGKDFQKQLLNLPNPTHECTECGCHNHNPKCCVNCGCESLSPIQSNVQVLSSDKPENTAALDPNVVIYEHPKDGPVSYMAFSNMKNMCHDILELMSMLNECDDLPQWVDQSISEAADRIAKAKRYVYGRKSV